MKKLSRTVRLISAAIAVSTTLFIFNSMVSIAEPHRTELMARANQAEKGPSTTTTLAMASTSRASVK